MANPQAGGQQPNVGAMLASMREHHGDGASVGGTAGGGAGHAAGINDADSLGVGGSMEPFNTQEGISFGTIGSAKLGGELDGIQGAFGKNPLELGPAAEPFGVQGMGVVQGKDLQSLGDTNLTSVAPGKQFNAPQGVPGLLPSGKGQGH
jgi:hypothetical protein